MNSESLELVQTEDCQMLPYFKQQILFYNAKVYIHLPDPEELILGKHQWNAFCVHRRCKIILQRRIHLQNLEFLIMCVFHTKVSHTSFFPFSSIPIMSHYPCIYYYMNKYIYSDPHIFFHSKHINKQSYKTTHLAYYLIFSYIKKLEIKYNFNILLFLYHFILVVPTTTFKFINS